MSSKKKSSELDGMIFGTLLGDGCIRKPTKAGTCNFILHHSTKQREYILHKLSLISEISHVKFSHWDKSQLNKKNGKTYYSIYAQSNFLNYFRKLRKIFYCEKTHKKVITKYILNKLTPLGLALWWMDDGCCYVHRGKSNKIERRAVLATQSFNYEEHLLIKEYFNTKLKISISIRQHPKTKQYYVSFPMPEFKKFINIVKPHVIASMSYKIDLKEELNLKTGPKKPVGQDN